MSFFAIDDNVLVNTDKIDSVEQRAINGEAMIFVYAGNKEYIVRRNVDNFLTLVHNMGKMEGTHRP